jgi:hypothetical protein
MGLDLETIRQEMLAYLEEKDFAVFRGYSRLAEGILFVYWDTSQHPDFHEFVDTAHKAGVKLVVFHHRALTLDQIDDALERLEQTKLPREDKRSLEIRLRELQRYEGFTAVVELTFDNAGNTYAFELRTDWHDTLTDILAEIDAHLDFEEEEEEDEGPISGYYSKN